MGLHLCKCGCGGQVKPSKIYIHGHNMKGVSRPLTDEQKRKMSEIQKLYCKNHPEKIAILTKLHLGKSLSEEHRTKISQANKGKIRTEEQRAKLSKAKTGNHHTEETKTKISEATKAQRMRTMGMPNSIDRTGTRHSEETKIKMGKAKKGNKFNLGKHHTDEARRKIGEAGRGRHHTGEAKTKISKASKEHWENPIYRARCAMTVGESNPHWLGGKSFEPYTTEFNKQLKYLIRVRDGFICQLCGMPERENGKNLPIHHVDYNKAISMPTNLISLCLSCNVKVNKNREHWTAYFRQLLNQRQLNPKSLIKKKVTKADPCQLTEYVKLGSTL